MADKTLDTKGLACPLPILKTKKVLSELPKGAHAGGVRHRPGLRARLHRPSARRPATRCSSRASRRRLPLRARSIGLRRERATMAR